MRINWVSFLVLGSLVLFLSDNFQTAIDFAVGIGNRTAASMELFNIRQAASTEGLSFHEGDNNEFRSFVRDTLVSADGSDASLDPWGEPYQLAANWEGTHLFSCGQDRLCNSDDDVTLAVASNQLR